MIIVKFTAFIILTILFLAGAMVISYLLGSSLSWILSKGGKKNGK